MKLRKFKRLAKKSLGKPDLINLTNDNELMDRVLRKSAEMQNELLKQAEEKEKE